MVLSISDVTSELACLESATALSASSPPQRVPGLKPGREYLSQLSVFGPGSVSSIIYVELSFVTRLISGWMEEG